MQIVVACNGYMLVLEDEMRDIFRAQAEGGAAPLQSRLEMWGWGVLAVSPGCPAAVAGTCSLLWHGEAQDCASLIAVVEATLCVFEVTKSPVFLFLSLLVLELCSARISSHPPTLQVPADIYPLPYKPWEMNFLFPWRKTQLWPSPCTPCSYFLPFPTANGCDKYCFSPFPAMRKAYWHPMVGTSRLPLSQLL